MLLTKEMRIKICYKNKEHYRNLGYNVKNGDIIIVPIKDLSPQSNKIVKVKCDVCGKVKEIKYQSYTKSIEHGGYYACSSECSQDKNRATNLKKYGVEFSMQNKEIMEKSKATCIKKYGVENISKSSYFKEKYENKMLEKYGVKNRFRSEEVKEKIRKTNIKKYGTDHHFKNKEYKKKYLYNKKNPAYIDGRSQDVDIWCSSKGKEFKREIFSTRERKCVCCGQEIRKMQIHHLYSRNTHPELTFNKENVVILCKP